jgi:hypothetical protein
MTFFFAADRLFVNAHISLSLDLVWEKTYSAPIQSNIFSFPGPAQLGSRDKSCPVPCSIL